jgi:LuxR family maltose regulon positive regulatory protein
VAQGAVDDALGWARRRGLSADDDLTYLREYEHVTLARALLARPTDGGGRSLHDGARLLDRLLAAAEEGKRASSVIEILVLQALAHKARSDMPAALALLEQALVLSEPEDFVRVFLDEGPPMAALLRAAVHHGVARDRAQHLLSSAGGPAAATRHNPAVGQGLVEPLSGRELDVLRLLRTELNGPDIARELMVSLNTMRTHTKSIFTKLGVNSRRAAVRRAAELDL